MTEPDRTARDYIEPGAEERERMREDFEFNDSDGDGRVDLQEFIRFMHALDPQMSEEEIRIGFEEIDADRSGAISFDEFMAWWTL